MTHPALILAIGAVWLAVQALLTYVFLMKGDQR